MNAKILFADLIKHFNYLPFRLSSPEQRDAFGILVSYLAKVKLMLGALNGELVAELPFVLMHPKVCYTKLYHFKLKINDISAVEEEIVTR